MLFRSDPEGRAALFYAMTHKNTQVTSALIQAGATPSALDADGRTCLFYATNPTCIAELLINHPNIINIQDNDGKTALFFAPNESVMQLLLLYGINPNIQDNQGQTALFTANTQQLVGILLDGKANPNICDIYGRTPIFYLKDNPALNRLLSTDFDCSIRDNNGFTALYYQNSEAAIYKIAFNSTPDELNKLNFEGRLPISYIKSPARLKKMIKLGADVNLTDKKGRHVLFYVDDNDLKQGDLNDNNSILTILSEAHCNPDIRDDNDELAFAAPYLRKQNAILLRYKKKTTIANVLTLHKYDELKSFMDLGIEPNARFSKTQTILTQAVSLNDEKLVEILVSRGADVNLPNPLETTPLTLAIQIHSPECCEVLLKAGAKVSSECFKLARKLAHPQILQLLWQYAPELKGNYYDYMTLQMRKLYQESVNSELDKVYKHYEQKTFNAENEFYSIYSDINYSALEKAVTYHDTEAVIFMMKKKIQQNTLFSMLITIELVNLAVNVNAPDILQLLCQYGILDSFHSSRYTNDNNPLALAINQCRIKCVEVLLHYIQPDDSIVTSHPGIKAMLIENHSRRQNQTQKH